MNTNNYFFIDGSALLGDIKRTKTELNIDPTLHLDLIALAKYFTGGRFVEFHQGGYRRFVYYFVQDDERLRTQVILPDFTCAGVVSDVRIEYCGKRIKQFEQAKTWLDENNAPDFVRDCLYRSEKAVDTQICCDALQLAGTGKLDRLFLYTNDFDFTPLCRTLRQLGANINLFRLRADAVNAALANECDALHDMDEATIRAVFKKKPDISLRNLGANTASQPIISSGD